MSRPYLYRLVRYFVPGERTTWNLSRSGSFNNTEQATHTTTIILPLIHEHRTQLQCVPHSPSSPSPRSSPQYAPYTSTSTAQPRNASSRSSLKILSLLDTTRLKNTMRTYRNGLRMMGSISLFLLMYVPFFHPINPCLPPPLPSLLLPISMIGDGSLMARPGSIRQRPPRRLPKRLFLRSLHLLRRRQRRPQDLLHALLQLWFLRLAFRLTS